VKLNDTPDGVGVDSVQLRAQHKRAASALSDLSLLRALSQHFIFFSFGACSGVPETTPAAIVKTINSNVSRFITKLRISRPLRESQSITLPHDWAVVPVAVFRLAHRRLQAGVDLCCYHVNRRVRTYHPFLVTYSF
jgi:hypothetical protein